jgi:hypothetical protein
LDIIAAFLNGDIDTDDYTGVLEGMDIDSQGNGAQEKKEATGGENALSLTRQKSRTFIIIIIQHFVIPRSSWVTG